MKTLKYSEYKKIMPDDIPAKDEPSLLDLPVSEIIVRVPYVEGNKFEFYSHAYIHFDEPAVFEYNRFRDNEKVTVNAGDYIRIDNWFKKLTPEEFEKEKEKYGEPSLRSVVSKVDAILEEINKIKVEDNDTRSTLNEKYMAVVELRSKFDLSKPYMEQTLKAKPFEKVTGKIITNEFIISKTFDDKFDELKSVIEDKLEDLEKKVNTPLIENNSVDDDIEDESENCDNAE